MPNKYSHLIGDEVFRKSDGEYLGKVIQITHHQKMLLARGEIYSLADPNDKNLDKLHGIR